MPTHITDLDELLGEDKHVRLKGKVYVLPPDIPAELYLRINKFAQENPDASEFETIEKLYEQLLELFRYADASITELPLTLSQVMLAIGQIYGDAGEEQEKAGPPPRRPTRGGASTRKTTKRSR